MEAQSPSSVYSSDLSVHPGLSDILKEIASRVTDPKSLSPLMFSDTPNPERLIPMLGEFSDSGLYSPLSPIPGLSLKIKPNLRIDTELANMAAYIRTAIPNSPASCSRHDVEYKEMDEATAQIPEPLNVTKTGLSLGATVASKEIAINEHQSAFSPLPMSSGSGFDREFPTDSRASNQNGCIRRSASRSSVTSSGSTRSSRSGRSVKLSPQTVQIYQVDPAVLVAQSGEVCVATPRTPSTPLSPMGISEKSPARYVKPLSIRKQLTTVGTLAAQFEQASMPAAPMHSTARKVANPRAALPAGVVAGLKKKFEFE